MLPKKEYQIDTFFANLTRINQWLQGNAKAQKPPNPTGQRSERNRSIQTTDHVVGAQEYQAREVGHARWDVRHVTYRQGRTRTTRIRSDENRKLESLRG